MDPEQALSAPTRLQILFLGLLAAADYVVHVIRKLPEADKRMAEEMCSVFRRVALE